VDIFVNDSPVEDLDTAGQTLEQVLRCVQEQRCEPGRVIVGLRCDGLELHGEEMRDRLARSAASLNRLEVFTGSPFRLVVDAMTQCATALGESDAERRRAADLLTEGAIAEGVGVLSELIRVYQQIHTAVGQSLEMLALDARTVVVNGRSLHDSFEDPKALLLRVRQALLSRDYVMLADIMQYEFDELIGQWQVAVADLRSRAEAREAQEPPII